eukprot:scaffold4.g4871.t1
MGCRPLRLTLGEWGLPPGVVAAFEAKGVQKMYPWQAAALECGEGLNNLVYTAPTSGGKSLVAEVLMIRRLERSKQMLRRPRGGYVSRYGRALVILPYISIVAEKAAHLAEVLAPVRGLTVKGYFGSEEGGQPLAPRGETVAVCTIEKANVAINRLAAEGRLGELCCVVVGDGARGLALEMALAKVLLAPQAAEVTVVGMSATMGGLESLRRWLRAELFMTNYRPVPLSEHAVFRGKVYARLPKEQWQEGEAPLELVRELAPSDKRDPDRLVPLLAEVVCEGHSALVFCQGRKSCETCARLVAELLAEAAPVVDAARAAALEDQRAGVIADIRTASGGGMSEALEWCMLRGVAWHHAGLTSQERAGVERAYRMGCLSVVTATSTLAAGINLPARRVVLRSLKQGLGPVSCSQYLQMVGRAGRAGHCPIGESFILGSGHPKGSDWQAISRLLTDPVPSLQSQLLPEAALTVKDLERWFSEDHTRSLQQLLLEAMANGSVRSGADVARLLQCTFGAHQLELPRLHAATRAALRSLQVGKRLIALGAADNCWSPTPKGRAVFDSALPLLPAMELYDALLAAGQGLQLGSPLALVFHALLAGQLPFDVTNWAGWQRLLKELPPERKSVAVAVGCNPDSNEMHCVRMGQAAAPEMRTRHAKLASALALCDLMAESSVAEVVRRYGAEGFLSRGGVSAGQVQKLQADAGKWLAMAGMLAESAGWWLMATLYSNLAQTAAAGVRQELLPLMRVGEMCAAKARALFKAGFKSPYDLATADEGAVAKALAACFAQQLKQRPKYAAAGAVAGPARRPGSAGSKVAEGAAAAGAAGMAGRAARAIVRVARELVVSSNRQLASLAQELVEEQADEEAAAGEALTASEQAELAARVRAAVPRVPDTEASQPTPEVEARPQGEVSIEAAALTLWTKGQSRVVELRPATRLEVLQQFVEAWEAAPHFALAVFVARPAQAAQAPQAAPQAPPPPQQPEQQQGRAAGLAVCWESKVAFFLELSACHLDRKLESGGTLRAAVARLLARPAATKLVHSCEQALPALAAAGLAVGGPVEDPLVAAWLLAPEAPAAEASLKALHAKFAPQCSVRVPSFAKGGVTATARAALLTLATAGPLRSLLAARGMAEVYSQLEMPAAVACAAVNAAGGGRLACGILWRARSAALEAARDVELRLQDALRMPLLFSDGGCFSQILAALKLPVPARPKRNPVLRAAASSEHLQAVLEGNLHPCQREIVELLAQHASIYERVLRPTAALLELAAGAGQADGQPRQGQPAAALALQLSTLDMAGKLTYGEDADKALAAVAGLEWTPLLALGALGGPQGLSLQQELMQGSVSGEEVDGAAGGVPVALAVPRWQLGGGGSGGASSTPDQLLALAECEEQDQEEVWLCGHVVRVLGKRLRTALDFTQPPEPWGGTASPQRVTMAAVLVTPPPGEDRSCCASGGSWRPAPPPLELHVPCSALWRLTGPAADVFGGGGGFHPPAQLGGWRLGGFCSALGALALEPAPDGASSQLEGVWRSTGGTGLLMAVRLLRVELLVLAQLSGERGLRAACTSAEPYRHVAACWAVAARQVAGGGGGEGQRPLLISERAAEAVAQALCHSWSAKRLGWVLRCSMAQAAAVNQSFLQAFPTLAAWVEAATRQAEEGGGAVTLAGRHRMLALPPQPDPMALGKLHKAALQHALGGSVADVTKAAFVALSTALRSLHASTPPPAPQQDAEAPAADGAAQCEQRASSAIALVLGACLVVRCGAKEDVAAAATAVRRAVAQLRVGGRVLDAPVAARITAGPSLHPLHQAPLAV